MKLLFLSFFAAASFWAQAQSTSPISIRVDFAERVGPLHIDQMALGQGGLSDNPMWADRIQEIRALHPRIIRIFIQEYFNLMPEPGHYQFATLDRSVDTIMATGAQPLMCICFKPRALFPTINQDVVEPNDYTVWEELVFNLVRHYKERAPGIQYWEIANEPDIGEDGGCPYRFQPSNYNRYFQHTAATILRADPAARVGGPALANVRSPILPALLEFCHSERLPLHFVSWHIYSSSPKSIASTVDYVSGLLKKFPAFHPETFLDEWNMDLGTPPGSPSFQPCYVAEAIWQMKRAGLDYSCYYHIRDWHVSYEQFRPFMSEHGTAFMTRWWNRMPQFDGLFDYQNNIRPAYFTFKLLARLAGDQLRIDLPDSTVHGFATHDDRLRMDNLLLWNFSDRPAAVEVFLANLPKQTRVRHLTLDAATGHADENARLRPDPPAGFGKGDQRLKLAFEPYAIHYWSFE